jgi:hypothetical protein
MCEQLFDEGEYLLSCNEVRNAEWWDAIDFDLRKFDSRKKKIHGSIEQ